MVGSYGVCMDGRAVGRVQVEREGLYYRFSCRCAIRAEGMHRVVLRCGGREQDLGLCVPMDGGFGTEKRIPAKQCGDGVPEFVIRPKGADTRGKFVPLSPEEPFAYIHRLQDAFLEQRGERLGIIVKLS